MPKASRSKPAGRSTRRRSEIRRSLGPGGYDFRAVLGRPELLNILLVLAGFIVLVSLVVNWSQDQPRVRVDEVMNRTRLKRLDYRVVDEQATARKREEARKNSPRIYYSDEAYLSRLEAALNGLPTALAGKTSPETDVSAELREEFIVSGQQKLTATALKDMQAYVAGQGGAAKWQSYVTKLIHTQLARSPLLESDEYQIFFTTLGASLLRPDGELQPIRKSDLTPIELTSSPEITRLRDVVRSAGFLQDSVGDLVYAKILSDRQPTLRFDAQRTEQLAAAAGAAVSDVFIEHKTGEPIYRRGERLTPDQRAQLMTEVAQFRNQATAGQTWLPRLGLAGLIALLTIFAGAYVGMNYDRVSRNAMRVLAIAALMLGMLVIVSWGTAQMPELLYPAAFATTLIVSITMMLAYEQRLAAFIGTLQCALTTLALDQNVAWFVLLLTANGVVIAQLHELRHRNSLIRASAVTGAFVLVGVLLHGLYDTPMVEGAWTQILMRSGFAAIATVAVGFLMLGILPSVERIFDITTGMTLAELRDTKQPLLRQLQQKAPGTYNHSLQVANIAEAAADAIGADSLLVYVGALYHDVGKMNKPEYFVENQPRGRSKHEGLSPAMSLLVIIGHVKDGIELAREYNLPRSIQHFIESHHGTTLVEYFYHAARERADIVDKSAVTEFEFRYPGPKPRTKEAAILMLCDAVESATRAMAEPNPGRIESVVRKISRKRLIDGQFDQCDLTFRELNAIEDAAITRLCAIHHGRIAYPTIGPAQGETGIDDTGAAQVTKTA